MLISEAFFPWENFMCTKRSVIIIFLGEESVIIWCHETFFSVLKIIFDRLMQYNSITNQIIGQYQESNL